MKGREENLSIRCVNRPKMANRSILWMGKSWENVLVCDYIFNRQRIYSSYRDLKFFTRCVKGYHLSVKDLRKGYLKAEGKGLDVGAEPLLRKLC